MYNQVFNQSGDGDAEYVSRGGLPVIDMLSSDVGGNGGGLAALDNKVVPVGLAVILRQPKRNTEYEKTPETNSSRVIDDELFDRLFDSVSPSSKRRRTTPSKKIKVRSHEGTRRMRNKKSAKST